MLPGGPVLLATDLSVYSRGAHTYAADLASRLGEELHVIHVQDGASQPAPSGRTAVGAPDRVPRISYPFASRMAHEAPDPASAADRIADAVVEYAVHSASGLLVIGARGSGRRTAAGSVATTLARRAPCPILLVRHAFPDAGIRRLLVPVDLSDHSRDAVADAAELARAWRASMDLLHVVPPEQLETSFARFPAAWPGPSVAQDWEKRLRTFADESTTPLPGGTQFHVRTGPPAPTIINFALERSPDMIVIGSHGQTADRHVAMGRVASSVSVCGLCPVLTLRSLPLLDAPRGQHSSEPGVRRNPRSTSMSA